MNGEYEQIKVSARTAFRRFVESEGRDRELIRGFLEAHKSLRSFRLRTGLGVVDRVSEERDLRILNRVDLDTPEGIQAGVEYLNIQLDSARRLREVARDAEELGGVVIGYDAARIGIGIERASLAYERAIDFLSA